jgi:menaquinol-cytochrome c reductase iron-sulfur subunit
MADMSKATDPNRRRLLVVLGAGAATVAGAPIGASLLGPVGKATVREGEDFVDVGSIDEISGEKPMRVTIKSDRQDAWTTFRNVDLGSAWILKNADGTVTAFSSACPHLGCSVDFVEKKDCFECPCHDGVFAKKGDKVSGPAPRGLDKLQARVEGGRVLVRFAKAVV